MPNLTFCGEVYAVDHAVKGADYIHGYDASGVCIIAFEDVADLSAISYDGEYLAPGDCEAEVCNKVVYCGGKLKTLSGTPLKLRTTDVAVAASDFIEDTTNEDYPYRAKIAIEGATAEMKPDVSFSFADVTSGIFAPVAESYEGGGGDTLTWDGNTEGLVSIAGVCFKVSDAVPTADDFSNGVTISVPDGTSVKIPAEEVESMIDESGLVNGELFLCVPYDGYDIGDGILANKGTYFAKEGDFYVVSLSISGYTGFGGGGGVYIYASEAPETDITIPVIDLWR